MKRALACLVAGGLSACTYQVERTATEPAPIVSAYADKVPGKWALLVDADKATAALQASGPRCSQSDYPLDFTKSFKETAIATFRQVTQDVRLFDHELSRAELQSQNFTGTITVRLTDLRAKVDVAGLVDGRADAHTEIDATVLVVKGGTRMVDASETGIGDAGGDAGLACGGTADEIAEASDKAEQDIVRKLAEQFANSHDVRYEVPGLSPQ